MIAETLTDRSMVTIDHYKRKSQVADRSMSVSMTLSDRERQDARGQIFPADLCNYDRIVWPRTNRYGYTRRRGMFLTGQSHPQPKGAGPQSIHNFRDPYTCTRTVWETVTKLCIVIRLDERKIFTGSMPVHVLAQIFHGTNADARSVCGS